MSLIPVTTHVTDIPARLKEVRESWFVVLNTETQKFEIHDSKQPFSTFCCALPFEELDARAIEYARKYHVSRLEENAREIEEYNARLEEEALRRHLDLATEKTKEAMAYLKRDSTREALPKELLAEQ